MPDNVQPTMAPWDALQTILAKRQAQKQQAMIAQLNAANIQSEIAARNENAATQAEARKALADQRQEAANLKKLGTYTPGPVSGEGANWLKSNFPQMVNETPGTEPLKPGDEGPTMPAQTEFMGTPDYQEHQRVMKGYQDLLNDPEFSKMDPRHAMMRIMQLQPEKTDAKTIESLLMAQAAQNQKEEEVPYYDIDRQGRPVQVAKVPKNAIFKQQPAPERETYTPFTDADGNIVQIPNHGGAPVPVKMPQAPQKPVTSPGTYMRDATGKVSQVPIDQVSDKQAQGWGFAPAEAQGPTKYFRVGTQPKPTATSGAGPKANRLPPDIRNRQWQATTAFQSNPNNAQNRAAWQSTTQMLLGDPTYSPVARTEVKAILNQLGGLKGNQGDYSVPFAKIAPDLVAPDGNPYPPNVMQEIGELYSIAVGHP